MGWLSLLGAASVGRRVVTRFEATVSASNSSGFETIATYRGDLASVQTKLSRKLRQWQGQAAMRGCKVGTLVRHNWGASWEGSTAGGQYLRVSAAIRVAS